MSFLKLYFGRRPIMNRQLHLFPFQYETSTKDFLSASLEDQKPKRR